MKRILIAGCGDIAMRVIPMLIKRYRVFAAVRNPDYRTRLRLLGAKPILCDLDDRTSLQRLAGLAHVVLHFAPPFLPAEKGREGMASDSRTRNLLAALSRGNPPQRFIYISTSGVYGDCAGRVVDETHPLNPETPRAQHRADAERQIRVWAKRNGVNASILRVPGIYAANRLPLARLRQGASAIIASEDGYTNHIHADDLARIVAAALHYARPNRVYHASDDSELKMGEYLDAVADACGLPKPERISRAEAQRVLSPMLLSFMNESRRLTNVRMKRELKVVLCYPTVADGLRCACG